MEVKVLEISRVLRVEAVQAVVAPMDMANVLDSLDAFHLVLKGVHVDAAIPTEVIPVVGRQGTAAVHACDSVGFTRENYFRFLKLMLSRTSRFQIPRKVWRFSVPIQSRK